MKIVDETIAKLRIDRDSGCWVFGGSKNPRGYGLVSVRKQMFNENTTCRPHRLLYAYFIGPFNLSLTLDHLCRNPACCNPWHLEPVTLKENILRGECPCAINARKHKCACGQEYTAYYRGDKLVRRCRPCTLARQAKWYRDRVGRRAAKPA